MMALPRPPKDYYPLAEITESWKWSIDSLLDYAARGKIVLTVPPSEGRPQYDITSVQAKRFREDGSVQILKDEEIPGVVLEKDLVELGKQQYPGGITWVDYDYDERLRAAQLVFTKDLVVTEEERVRVEQVIKSIVTHGHDELDRRGRENEKSSKGALTGPAIQILPNIRDLTWGEIKITVLSDDMVQIVARDDSHKIHFAGLGFAKHGDRPRKSWETLLMLANLGGELSWGAGSLEQNERYQIKVRISELRKRLRQLFKIEDDPFFSYRERNEVKSQNSYKTRFQLVDARHSKNDVEPPPDDEDTRLNEMRAEMEENKPSF